MALFDKGHRLLHGLSKLQRTQKHSETSSAEGRDGDFFCCLNILSGVDDAHVIEFFEELFCGFDSKLVVGREVFDFGDEGSDHSADFIIVMVVVPVLEVVLVDDFGLSFVGFDFPIVEVDFFEQLLLVVFKFAHIVVCVIIFISL